MGFPYSERTCGICVTGFPFGEGILAQCTVQDVREGLAGKPRALVAAENLRLAVSAQGLLQAIDTELRFQGVADPSIEGFAARRVADRHQVGEATRQPDVDSARQGRCADRWRGVREVCSVSSPVCCFSTIAVAANKPPPLCRIAAWTAAEMAS